MQKGSTTRMPHGATIPAGTTASRKRMTDWRTDIRTEAARAMGECPPWHGAVRIMVEFALRPPVSLAKRHHGWLPHTKRPDLDKLERMLCDALRGICYADDSQVTNMASGKVYAWDGKTGANITVSFVNDETAIRVARMTQGIREYVSR